MMINLTPFSQSYWNKIKNNYNPKKLPWLVKNDNYLNIKLCNYFIKYKKYSKRFFQRHIEDINNLAKKNISDRFAKFSEESLNQLFLSIEQPPYDEQVKHCIIPFELKDNFIDIMKGAYYIKNKGDIKNYLYNCWGSTIIFSKKIDKNMIIVIGEKGMIQSIIIKNKG